MATNRKEVLEQVFGEILENVAFMFADAADPDDPAGRTPRGPRGYDDVRRRDARVRGRGRTS